MANSIYTGIPIPPSPHAIISRLLTPVRNVISHISRPHYRHHRRRGLSQGLPPPATPRFQTRDTREELSEFEKAAGRLLEFLNHLERPPAHILSLGPDVAAMVSFHEGVAFSRRRAPQPADLDPIHHYRIHRIQHHIKHLLEHLREESPSLIATADLEAACQSHCETDALEKRFKSIQDDVHRWCGKAFGGQKQLGRGDSELVTAERWADTERMSVAAMAECVFWTFVEERWVTTWFPVGLDHAEKIGMEEAEEKLRLCAGNANTESWRACTCELLSRCSVRTIVSETDIVFKELDDAFKLLAGHRISRYSRSSFRHILEVTLKLAMAMKSCSSFYELDHAARLGDQFNETTMEVTIQEGHIEENGGDGDVVVAIVSRGIMERAFRGDTEVVGWVRKNRVLLGRETQMETADDSSDNVSEDSS